MAIMDKAAQLLFSKFASSPQLRRRIPIAASGVLPSLVTQNSDVILSNKHAIVHSLSPHKSEKSRSNIGSMIEKAGGTVLLPDIYSDDGHGKKKMNAVVCDARGIISPHSLSLLHSDLQDSIKKLGKNGRIVVIGNDITCNESSSMMKANHASVAASRGIQGFVKSLSKEMCGKGVTCNMIMVPASTKEDICLSGPLNFFLSDRSSFISGQTLRLSNNNLVSNECNGKEQDLADDGDDASLFSMMNKTVILTGAARGIGAFTAKLFHAEGAKLLLVDHPSMETALKSLAEQLGQDSCSYLSLDITDNQSNQILKEAILTNHMFKKPPGADSCDSTESGLNKNSATVDAFVHNAGITRDKLFKNMKSDAFESVIDVNLLSVMKIDEMLFSNAFLKPGSSRIVYLSSISGVAGNLGQTNYSCSKAGVMGYVESLGKDVNHHGVGVNAVAPGFIETEMTDKIPIVTRTMGRYINALKQGGYPLDVAEAVLFLSSQASSGINGNTLRVCGHHIIG